VFGVGVLKGEVLGLVEWDLVCWERLFLGVVLGLVGVVLLVCLGRCFLYVWC
jgi:hypothetical protein